MKLEFTHPEFFWGLLLIAAVAWIHRKSLVDLSRSQRTFLLVLRSAILVLLVLTLAGLTLRLPSCGEMVVFLVDRSRGIDADAERFADDFVTKTESLLDETPCETVDFAAAPRLRMKNAQKDGRDDKDVAQGRPGRIGAIDVNETNIAAALKPAVALVPPSRSPHIVLLSDGNETAGNALQTVRRTLRSSPPGSPGKNVRISTVPLPASSRPEVQLAELRAPARVRRGEPFFLDVVVLANRRTQGTLRVFRNDFKIVEETKELEIGENLFRFPRNADEDRAQSYSVTISSSGDTILENNVATASMHVDGVPRILLLESDPDTVFDFVAAMREQEIEIDARPPTGFPDTLDALSRFDAVIFSDVPATAFSVAQTELLRKYVRDLGGGFLMFGGEQSFGPGGYTETTLNDLLPVRGDFEKEQEKPSLAMCLAIDRSGSMQGEKLELAKDAAKSVVELLSARDFVAVVAFDAAAHAVVPAQNVLSPSTIRSQIARIAAEGGTSIYPALLRAFEELETLPAKLKHVVLLTDGQSEPGEFEAVTRRMVAAKITLTTVGVGDADHDLLGRLAEIGQGRYYRCDDPRSIPQIFARETITASKSALREIPFLPVTATRSEMLEGLSLDAAPPLLGFVKTESKPTARTVLVTETGEPLLATCRYGLGVSVAFTSDVKARWAAEWATWPDFPVFWGQVLRYAMRKPDSGRSRLVLERVGNRARVELDVLDEEERFLNKAAGHVNLVTPDGKSTRVPLRQTGPGHYESHVDLPQRGSYHFQPVLRTEDGRLIDVPARTLSVGYPEELRLKPPNTALLKEIAEATGGLDAPTPEEIARPGAHDAISSTTWESHPLWPWVLPLVVCLFLFDVLLRRVDFGFGIRPAGRGG